MQHVQLKFNVRPDVVKGMTVNFTWEHKSVSSYFSMVALTKVRQHVELARVHAHSRVSFPVLNQSLRQKRKATIVGTCQVWHVFCFSRWLDWVQMSQGLMLVSKMWKLRNSTHALIPPCATKFITGQ